MCGIVGFVNKDNGQYFLTDLSAWFRQALMVDTLRGAHSTGVLTLNNHAWEYYKKAMNAWDFMQFRPAEGIMQRTRGAQAVIGHNRHATVGKINDATAHPFASGNTIGVHNGTLNKTNQALREFNQFGTDSEALIYNIDQYGSVEAFENAVGAYAVVWVDAKQNTINFMRNNERSLYYVYSTDHKTLLFASEGGLIEWIADRNDILIEDVIYPFTAGTLYTMDAGNPDLGFTKTEVNIRTIPPSYYGTYNAAGNVGGNNNNNANGNYSTKGNSSNMAGYVKGERIDIRVDNFHRYTQGSNISYGAAHGTRVGGKQDSVLLNGVTENFFNKIRNKTVKARVSSVSDRRTSRGQNILILDVSSVEENGQPVTVDDEEKNDSFLPVQSPIKDEYPDNPKYLGPDGELLTALEFDKLVEDGCSYCQSPIWPEDAPYLHWVEGRYPICPTCLTEMPDLREVI